MTMAAIGALTLPKTTSKPFSIYGDQIMGGEIPLSIEAALLEAVANFEGGGAGGGL